MWGASGHDAPRWPGWVTGGAGPGSGGCIAVIAHVRASAVDVGVLEAEEVAHALQGGASDIASKEVPGVWVGTKEVVQLVVVAVGGLVAPEGMECA